ncbi:MAG: hypothetical protein P4L50_00675 [Anaerolineaceae bacterium]|nr:hypothetical protein [Anaerolineaceae bacterium]
MIQRSRKSAPALSRLIASLDRPIEGCDLENVVAKGPGAEITTTRACPGCGASAGIRETRDAIGGELAGECVACRTLIILA